MLDSLFNTSTTTTSTIDLIPFLICVLVALGLGFVLALVYSYRNRHSKGFVVTLAVIPAIVSVVIAMVNGNVGTGVAVAGAFSLVRFRSVAGSARDIGYIFLAMAIGLVCGMGYLAYAVLVTVVLGLAYFVYQAIGFGGAGEGSERTLRITVPEDLDYTTLFDDVLGKYTTECELAEVRTTNMGSLYRLIYDVTLADQASERKLIDELRCRNGNLEIALTRRAVDHDQL